MSYWSWEDRITCVALWRTVCWQMKLQIGTNWQQRTFWKEVCQSCLIQQLSTRGGLFHHNHPINFSPTCHTFRHAISMRIWTESIKARCAVRQRWITKKEKEKIGQGLGNLRISSIVHSTFCTGGRKCNYTCPLSLFRKGRCVKMRGEWWGLCPVAASTPILYANKRLFCILRGIWWQDSEWWAPEGECSNNSSMCVSPSVHMHMRTCIGGLFVWCLVSPEIVRIMKNSAGTSKQTAGHFLWWWLIQACAIRKQAHAHFCHIFLPWPVNATSFDNLLRPKKRRTTSLKSFYALLVFDLSVSSQCLEVKTRNASAMPDTSWWSFFKTLN